MGNKTVLFFLFIYLTFSAKSQENLIPNGSFEEYYSCPTNPGAVGDNQLELCKYWYKPSLATTDYYNACQTNVTTGVNVPYTWFGYQKAFDGNAFVGMYSFLSEDSKGAEYIQIKLLEALKKCELYKVRFWVSLGNFCSRATSTLGARLDTFPIKKEGAYQFHGFELPPHVFYTSDITDTTSWVLVEGIYEAKGGEKYLTIGRFLDTTLYSNDNVPNITVTCDSCFYDMYNENPAYYFIDSVSLVKANIEGNNKEVDPNIITCNNDGINDFWFPTNFCINEWECYIYNRWGNIVFQFNQSYIQGWNGNDFNGKQLNEGIYYYLLQENGKVNKTGFIQLIR